MQWCMHEDGDHGPVIVHNHSLGTTRTRGMGPGGSRDVDVKYVRGSSYAGTDRDRQTDRPARIPVPTRVSRAT